MEERAIIYKKGLGIVRVGFDPLFFVRPFAIVKFC